MRSKRCLSKLFERTFYELFFLLFSKSFLIRVIASVVISNLGLSSKNIKPVFLVSN